MSKPDSSALATLPIDAGIYSASADGRIAYLRPNGPVYLAGDDGSSPHAIYTPGSDNDSTRMALNAV